MKHLGLNFERTIFPKVQRDQMVLKLVTEFSLGGVLDRFLADRMGPRFLTSTLLSLLVFGEVACTFVPALKKDDFTVPSEFKATQKTDVSKVASNGANNGDTSDATKGVATASKTALTPLDMTEDVQVPLQARRFSTAPWWLELNDPVLSRLQDQLLQSNVSLLQLSAQVRLAQASLKQAEASLFPSLNVNMSASRAANQLSVPKGTSYSLSAPMSWEVDVWGRIDALTQVAASNARATQWDLKQAQVSVQALLVQTYVTLMAARGQEALLTQTVQVYEKSLKLTQARYQAGVVSSADVAQASTQLQSTQAQWQEVVLQRKQIEHALATLLGVVPAQLKLNKVDDPGNVGNDGNDGNRYQEDKGAQGISLPRALSAESRSNPATHPALPQVPSLPEVLVLNVLQHRADIQAAKRRVEAANAQLGVARAAFFPPLILSASAGYRNTDLASLIASPNQAWSIGPSLVLPLLDGGLRQAAKEGAQAQLDNAVLTYRQVVLSAFQEIEDNLVAQEQLALVERALRDATQSASKNLDVALAQYRVGVVPYLNVVSAQSASLSAQRSLLDVQSRRLLAWNQLKKNTFVQVTP
jgi:outer membrane protein TolC